MDLTSTINYRFACHGETGKHEREAIGQKTVLCKCTVKLLGSIQLK
jgi:hypothetical protein